MYPSLQALELERLKLLRHFKLRNLRAGSVIRTTFWRTDHPPFQTQSLPFDIELRFQGCCEGDTHSDLHFHTHYFRLAFHHQPRLIGIKLR
jgi:hypothetical protein